MTAADLEREFRAVNAHQSNLLILRASDALALIARARAEKIRILGIDGFRLIGDGIQPDMSESVDFTSAGRHLSVDTWAAAESFVSARRETDLIFEIVLD